jgi:DnaJ-class molecular chaperone
MKPIEEQTYYEILEVSPRATAQEIQRAYEHAKETFSQNPAAFLSSSHEQGVERVQSAIEEAYRVLMDEASRKNYDESHLLEFSSDPEKDETPRLPFTEISVEVREEIFRGKALRQIRERMGIDLKTLSEETRVNARILQGIEEEVVEKLPPLVYLKGFLRAYARYLGLDPQKVIGDYLVLLSDKKKK